MNNRSKLVLIFFLFLTFLLSTLLFFYGEAGLVREDHLILWQLRFPKIVVAFLSGGMLASAGLILQVYFQNPLAGPDLLGINAGATLGVAMALMGAPFLPENLVLIGQSVMALIGSLTVFMLLTFLVQKNFSRISLLILGLLIASFTSSFITVLVNLAPSLQVKNFLMWSMGSFQGLTTSQLPLFVSLSAIGILTLILHLKKLNLLMIGENYAKSMGVHVRSFKVILILICSLLVAVVTTYCGPIGFIGIIAPHISRVFMKRSDIRLLMPIVFLAGSTLALVTEFILIFTSEYSLATNSILGLIGAPVVALYLYRERRVL